MYINYPSEAATSTCLTIIFRRITRDVSWLLSLRAVVMELPHQCRHFQYIVTVNAGTDVGRDDEDDEDDDGVYN